MIYIIIQTIHLNIVVCYSGYELLSTFDTSIEST